MPANHQTKNNTMDKLYWIVCEESDKTLYEDKFQGRTRGSALKHLKEKLGRSSLTGLVFSITEIPVPLIQQLVRDYLHESSLLHAHNGNPTTEHSATTSEAPKPEVQADEPEDSDPPPSGAEPRSSYDWDAIKECYMNGHGPKDVAEIMNVPINTLRGRISREGWSQERKGRA